MVEESSGGRGVFPTTRHSAIFGLRSALPADRAHALEAISKAYWRPVYKYVRLHWRKERAEAEEVTQEFFLRSVEKGTFAAYDPARARFRTFVRVCLDRFVVDRARHGRALKRGAGAPSLAFDFGAAEGEIAAEGAPGSDPDELFEAAWVRGLMGDAVEALREACARKGKDAHFRAFERFHLGDDDAPPSYQQIGAELGLSVTDVTNYLSYARREFRAVVLGSLRELTGSEQELREEARRVLGVEL